MLMPFHVARDAQVNRYQQLCKPAPANQSLGFRNFNDRSRKNAESLLMSPTQ